MPNTIEETALTEEARDMVSQLRSCTSHDDLVSKAQEISSSAHELSVDERLTILVMAHRHNTRVTNDEKARLPAHKARSQNGYGFATSDETRALNHRATEVSGQLNELLSYMDPVGTTK